MGPEQAVDDAMQRICVGSVSTHALREEGDLSLWLFPKLQFISIHALREEGDRRKKQRRRKRARFQSTPSAGRATKGAQHTVIGLVLFQSTPSARRATMIRVAPELGC